MKPSERIAEIHGFVPRSSQIGSVMQWLDEEQARRDAWERKIEEQLRQKSDLWNGVER
jgi:hypothetical protein